MKIMIPAPAYNAGSGGIKVLHALGYLAHCGGHEVCMDTPRLNDAWPPYSQPLLDFDMLIVPEFMPETLPGIPTVRWVLYYPGRIGYGPTLYPRHEHVVIFYPEFREAAEAAAPGRKVDEFLLPWCTLPGLDEEGPVRDMPAAFWVGKGSDALVPPEKAVRISRQWPSNRRDLTYLLRSCLRFYSCDPFTAMNQEAQLCGCQVFVWSAEHNAFMPWRDPCAERLMREDHEVGVRRVDTFLKKCAKHFGLEEQ
jgi:hypothetical protein